MECREACKALSDFLEGTYPPDRQEELIRHLESCTSCREELKISLTLQMALTALDEDTDFVYTESEEQVRNYLDDANARVVRYHHFLQIRYALKTVTFWAVVLTLFLQVLYWTYTGFWFF